MGKVLFVWSAFRPSIAAVNISSEVILIDNSLCALPEKGLYP
jgi:hypothetical protein